MFHPVIAPIVRQPLTYSLVLKKRLAPGLFGLALSIVLASCSSKEPEAAAGPPPGLPVRLETLNAETVQASSEFVGTLEAIKIVEITPEASGRIESILVNSGQAVSAGQVIMVLKSDQSQPEYQAALTAVDVATAEQEKARKQLDIAKAQRNSLLAQMKTANVNIERAKLLAKEGAIAQFRLDEASTQYEVLKNDLLTAEEQIKSAELSISQADLAIRQSQAQAESAQVAVQSKEVVTPIAGIVDNLPVKVGESVSAGQKVVAKVTQTDALFLNIAVPADQAKLQVGLPVELLNSTTGEKLGTGGISFVSPTVDAGGQTVLAKARFSNVAGQLRDGQNVQARIIWDSQTGVLVPTTAISRVGGKEFVFVVDEQPNEAGQEVVRFSPVELGPIQGESYQVVSGLTVGDRIAVSNILKLRDGAPIAPDS